MLTGLAGPDPVRLFSQFDLASRASVIAAVSGGSDSTALLLLLKDYLERHAPHTRLVATTVDHALRPDSAREASDVGRLCARLGIAHSIHAWTGPKPDAGLPAAAREARYDLLARAADAAGTDLVFTGHTADDQVETVLMRQIRKQGRGLAGIAPATFFDGRIWIARPLLSTRRADLRTFLCHRSFEWIEDPSNANDDFERPRIRKMLRDAGGAVAIVTALETARNAALHRQQAGDDAASFIRDHVTRPAAGLLRLDRRALADAEVRSSVYVLRILLAAAGGTPHLPDERRTGGLLAHLLKPDPGRNVLSRALVDVRRDDVFLLREARGLPETASMVANALWDGRYRLAANASGASASVAPIGPGEARSLKSDDPQIPDSLVRAAHSREPAMSSDTRSRDPAKSVAAELVPVVAPWARFLPSFDVAPASAMGTLLRAGNIPDRPFREHIKCKA